MKKTEYHVTYVAAKQIPIAGWVSAPVVITQRENEKIVGYSLNSPKGQPLSEVFVHSGLEEGTLRRLIKRPDFNNKRGAFVNSEGKIYYSHFKDIENGECIGSIPDASLVKQSRDSDREQMLVSLYRSFGEGISKLTTKHETDELLEALRCVTSNKQGAESESPTPEE